MPPEEREVFLAASLPILTYHALDTSNAVTATDPHWFATTIERLVDAGLTGIDLPGWVARGCPAVDKGFAVTFDDGLRSVLAGVDVLTRLHVPATIFLVTGHVGKVSNWPSQTRDIPRVSLLDWSEVNALAHMGFSFGAHTATHPDLTRLAAADYGHELRESRLRIEDATNRPCELLAYPYGRSNEAVRDCAGRQFEAAFGTRLALTGARCDRFDMPRIDAYYLRSPRVLDRLIQGRLRPWLTVRRQLRSVRNAGRALRAGRR